MLKVTRVSTYAYDVVGGSRDYHLRLDDASNVASRDNPWILDIFDSGEVNNTDAHISSETFETLEEALNFICDEENEPNEDEEL